MCEDENSSFSQKLFKNFQPHFCCQCEKSFVIQSIYSREKTHVFGLYFQLETKHLLEKSQI